MTIEIKTHTNKNGETYYSRSDENGDTIYSFTPDFEDIWTQEDEDLYGTRYRIIGNFAGGKQLEWAGISGWVEEGDVYNREQAEQALESALASKGTDSPMLESATIQED